jgi:UDP-N-acetylglucosamine 1-carboxyvinyltransferase
MPPRFVVRGGQPLNGTIRPAGNKNAALPILAATVMAEGPSTIHNVPRIRDVEAMAELMAGLGATIEWVNPNSIRVDPANLTSRPLDPALCARIRASILLAGPLLARFIPITPDSSCRPCRNGKDDAAPCVVRAAGRYAGQHPAVGSDW